MMHPHTEWLSLSQTSWLIEIILHWWLPNIFLLLVLVHNGPSFPPQIHLISLLWKQAIHSSHVPQTLSLLLFCHHEWKVITPQNHHVHAIMTHNIFTICSYKTYLLYVSYCTFLPKWHFQHILGIHVDTESSSGSQLVFPNFFFFTDKKIWV